MIDASTYPSLVSELCGRLQHFAEQCSYMINEHPAPIAVSYIADAIDRLAPHLEEHVKVRARLFGRVGLYAHEREDLDDDEGMRREEAPRA